MTRWGALLLVLFVVLGLTKKPEAKAVAIAVWTTGVVMAYVMVKIVR